MSRIPRHRRIRLDALTPEEVVEFVDRENGLTLEPAAASSIYSRTAGNPFFVKELSRLLADGAPTRALRRIGRICRPRWSTLCGTG